MKADKNNGNTVSLGRRRSLQLIGAGLAASGLVALGCKGGGGGASSSGGGDNTGTSSGTGTPAIDCTIDDQSKTTRRTLQYNDKAVSPEKMCKNCAQFEPGKYGDCGGGCKVITGPVQPGGGCLSFAPKGGDGGSPT